MRTTNKILHTHRRYNHQVNLLWQPLSFVFPLENRFTRCRWITQGLTSCRYYFPYKKGFDPKNNLTQNSNKFLEFHQRVKNQEDSTISLSEWEQIEKDILTESPQLAPGLDFSIMKTLKNKPDMSASFMHYIKSKRQPNIPVLAEFFENCGEKHEDFVLEEFENLKKSYDPFHLHLKRNNIAIGIAKTREWRQCIEFLDFSVAADEQRLSNLSLQACSAVLKRALKHKDYDLFFQVWNKFSQVTLMNDFKCFSDMFFDSWKDGSIPFDVLMELLKLNEMPLQVDQFRELQKYWKSEWKGKINAKLARVGNTCRCSNCNEEIPEYDPIEETVFRKMGEEIFHKMLIGDNIFKKTSPKELDYFKNFMINQKYPFDYVIDGLNILHMNTNGQHILNEVIENLYKQGHRVLVLTKGYVKEEPKWKKMATIFTVASRSYDDCYLMLAAFLSGPECYVVTNDDFKDHIAVVDPALKPYFLKWRNQNRVFHRYYNLLHPPKYKWIGHETEKGWHIPCRKTPNYCGTEKDRNAYTFIDYKTRIFLCVSKFDYAPSSDLLQFRKAKNNSVSTNVGGEVRL